MRPRAQQITSESFETVKVWAQTGWVKKQDGLKHCEGLLNFQVTKQVLTAVWGARMR